MRHWFEHNGERMCDRLQHARQCGITTSRNVGRVGWSTARQGIAQQCTRGGVDPKTVRRDRPPDNPEVREEMKAIASKRRRFGYRRIGVLLERKGMIMNHKKLYRLYTDEKLGVRRRRGRKRARGSRTPMPVALRPGERWSLDFVSDTFGASRKFRMLAVNDDCCRENLCLVADTSISGARVARELDALVRIYGKPACIVSDNGTEFTSRAILKWAGDNNVD
jgi:putative transposase